MKKLCCVQLVMLLMIIVMPIGCMEQVVPYVSKKRLFLVENARRMSSEEFASYYDVLLPADRIVLIKSAGQYSDIEKQRMIGDSKVTRRLIEVYFKDNGLRTYIKTGLRHFYEKNE